MKKVIFICSILVASLAFSQEAQTEDLKVGLVLSGGGAKGLAHIGVLKAIEDAGVRIDYIGGTSMGAVVGALYAAGYSATQLKELFKVVDFNTLIQDEIPRGAKTFYEKGESDKYALTLPFDNFQLGIPSALSKGQNVYNLLSRLTLHVNEISDFSQLPIPFFCVATNVETGESVILEEGYLPRAITASGALPTLLSPVIIDDMMLVDGGVVNNYPIDEVRAKGMDIIIGVDVQDGLKDRNALKSAFDLLIQINNFRTIDQMKVKKAKTDIYIHPNIEEFSVVSFSDSQKIVENGFTEGEKFKNELEALSAQQKEAPNKKIEIQNKNNFYINSVEINGNEKYSRAYVLGKLKLKTPSEMSYKDFSDGVNNLSATGNFQVIDYRFIPTGDDEYKVVFTLIENRSNMLLRFAVHYDDLFKTAGLVNITRKRLFTNNDIASLDLIVGDNLRYNFNYYIDKGFYWSIGFNSSYNFFHKDVDINFVSQELDGDENNGLVNKVDMEYGDLTNQLYVETLLRRSFSVGGGFEYKWLRYLSETIGIDENNNPRTIFENSNYSSLYGFLKYDTFDDSFFPKNGIYFNGDYHLYLFASGMNENFNEFSIAKARMGYAKSFLSKFSAVLSAEGGFKIGDDSTESLDFFLGGYGFKEINNIEPLYGYEALSLRGNTYLKSNLTIDYEFYLKNHVNFSANIANIGDDILTRAEWIDGIDYSGFAIGYGLETFLGPIEAKYSYSPERDVGEWYVSAGFRF